ncbi:MAG: hypothetical protein AAB710_00085 [Patescibacteria group bacterium]
MGSITKEEYRKLKSTLKREGLSDSDIKNLDKVTSGHFDREASSSFLAPHGKAMSKKEAEDAVTYLREHPSQHSLSKSQIEKTEREFKEDLND